MIKNFKWLLLVSLTFVACSESDDEVTTYNSTDGLPVTSGDADFSKYVALGDSFAAGYSDGALFKGGQEGSYPNLLAQQFALAGGGEFTQPYMNDNFGGLLFMGTQVQNPRLYYNGVAPTMIPDTPTTEVTTHLSGTFSNLGVPGAKSFHLTLPNYGDPAGVPGMTASPYFARFASSPSASVIQDAVSQNPTFFSLWIGGNDELGYATSGGDPALSPLTPPATFETTYNSLLTQLKAGGAKGVIANLPSVTTLPYFYVIKYNQLTQANLSVGGTSMVPTLNAQLYGPLHNALAFLGQGDRINLLSATGNNPMIMVDETLTDLSAQLTAVMVGGGLDVPTATVLGQVFGRARQTLPTDLICLSTASRIGKLPSVALDGVASPAPSLLAQLGVTFPLPDRYVLLPSEVAEIQVATDAYNATIETAKVTYDVAMVDAKSIMTQLTGSGIRANGVILTSAFVYGGAFSTDGIHPSPRGYALIANKFIEAINAKYGSNMKGVNLGNYRILFPANSSSF